jgi:hypothetical protein
MTLQGDIFKSDSDGETTTFNRAFPTIAAIGVDIDETGEGNHGLGRRSLTRRSMREYINCSSPHCSGKGLDLGLLLREMIATHQRECKVERVCAGHDEAGNSCKNVFHVALHVTYR